MKGTKVKLRRLQIWGVKLGIKISPERTYDLFPAAYPPLPSTPPSPERDLSCEGFFLTECKPFLTTQPGASSKHFQISCHFLWRGTPLLVYRRGRRNCSPGQGRFAPGMIATMNRIAVVLVWLLDCLRRFHP